MKESNQLKISNLGNVLHNMSCSMDDEDEQNEFGGYATFCWDLADEFRNSECVKSTTKKQQSVFTKEMQDAGKLPEVGMQCNFETTFFTTVTSNKGICEIIAYFEDKVWINIIDFDCVINTKVIDFSPIDKRTYKEKAIDEIMTDEFIDNGLRARDLIEAAYDKWVGE